jgi:clan AA aspartic protease (TIGR02281 family)
MSQFGRLAVQALGSVVLAGALLSGHLAYGQSGGRSAPPAFIHDEIQRAENDFASGGASALAADWSGCVERVRASHDANAAERCIVYGDSALLLNDADGLGGGTPLSENAVIPGQLEMLDVMGIPYAARQPWLDRFRRQVRETYRPDRMFASGSGFTSDGVATPDRGFRDMPERAVASNAPPPPSGYASQRPAAAGRADLGPAALADEVTPVSSVAPALGYTPSFGSPQSGSPQIGSPQSGSPQSGPPQSGPPRSGPPQSGPPQSGPPQSGPPQVGPPQFRPAVATDDAAVEPRADLARTVSGLYPREALRQPAVEEALRGLLGAELFEQLKDYTYGNPMEFNGRFAVGAACVPRDCGGSAVRFVFGADNVWVGLIGGGQMRIYGNPPKAARGLLVAGPSAVRAPVEATQRPVAPPLLPVSASTIPRPTPAEPRLQPRPQPALQPGPQSGLAPGPRMQPEAAQSAPPDGGVTEVRMRRRDGAFDVPVTINDTMTVQFSIDSGSSDVSVSPAVLRRLMDAGTVAPADFMGKQTYHLADGSRVASDTFRIHSLRVGDKEVHDVIGSVSNDSDTLLLGQSFLSRFHSWSIDNQRGVLLLR